MTEALRQRVATKAWKNASINANNLSEFYVVLGELAQAEARGREAVAYAHKSGDAREVLDQMTTHASALHQLGRTSDARALFAEAESMHVELQPALPLLYSISCSRYCDLLLGEGEADEVLRRTKQTLLPISCGPWLSRRS